MDISSIKQSQKQYLDLLKSFEELISNERITQKQIAMILDEIECFWLDKKDILLCELENLTTQKDCFLLTGAVYLNVKDDEHYIFKSLGDEHVISDPLLKLENFFRLPRQMFDEGSIDVFKRAFLDTIEVLSKFDNYFYILPINLISIENPKEHMELLQNYLLSFINTMLNEDFEEIESFLEKYLTYEDIEEHMTDFFRTNLTFNDYRDEKLSLREKVELHISNQAIMSSIFNEKSDSEKFILSLQGLVLQIMDILLVSVISNTIPAIRYKPTFHYLTTVMYTFIGEEFFKNTIEKTIVFYIFYYTVDKEELKKNEFVEFVDFLRETNFLELIIQEMRIKEINIFEGGIEKVGNIIEEVFCNRIYEMEKFCDE